MTPEFHETHRFGQFELDVHSAELRRNGRRVKVQPQPLKLLVLLARRSGALVTRDEIRTELWPSGTYVDFDQAVNFAVKQIREALGDSADRPLYLETVPRRGYRFIAPIERSTPESTHPNRVPPVPTATTTVRLEKALWANIAELRMAEERRRRLTYAALAAGSALLAGSLIYVLFIK